MNTKSIILLVTAALISSIGGLSAATAWRTGDEREESPRVAPRTITATRAAVAQDDSRKGDDQKGDDGRTKLLKDFMRQKLKSSNRILEGLMVDDLKMVDEAAEALLEMSQAEEWRASTDLMYLQHSREFGTAVQDLRAKAKKDSLDGASLAWINVTMKCIHCHEWVRNTILADAGTEVGANDLRPAGAELLLPEGNGFR